MVVTFLIGNGFDIKMGLKSRYIDFYAQIESDKIKENSIYSSIYKDTQTWADFETALGQETKKCVTEEDKQNLSVSLLKFKQDFQRYLIEQQKAFTPKGTEEMFVKSLTQFDTLFRIGDRYEIRNSMDTFPQGTYFYNFVVFNYTEVFFSCLDQVASNLPNYVVKNSNFARAVRKRVQIHGTLTDDMLLGVNDESQYNANLFCTPRDKCWIEKPATNQLLKTQKNESVMEMIKESNVICIYGMSLGATDKIWWQKIADLLCRSNSILLIFGFNSGINLINPAEKYHSYEAPKETFLSHLDIDDANMKNISSRIYVSLDENMFG